MAVPVIMPKLEMAQETATVKVTHDEREANAKSILGVLTLGANQGAVITIRAEGLDADQSLAALEALVEGNFGETG